MAQQFKVRDLMINVIPKKWGNGAGGAGLCSMDSASVDHTPLTPHTPVIMVANATPKVQVLDAYADRVDKLKVEHLEGVAQEIGRAAVAGKFMPGAALCSEEMATCANNERISPFASEAGLLEASDLAELKVQLHDAVAQIERVEKALEARTREHARELVPRLEAALKDLQGHGMIAS